MANDEHEMEIVEDYSTDESDDIGISSEENNAKLPNPISVGVMHVSPEGVPSWVLDVPDDIKPAIGKSFDDTDVAYEFYQLYTKQAGFPSKKSSNNRNKRSQVSWKYFLCSKHGFPNAKTPIDSLAANGKKPDFISKVRLQCQNDNFIE